MTGVVTKIFRQEEGRKDRGGYFFIRDSDGHDRFAHARDIGQDVFQSLKEKAQVEFEPRVVSGGRGNGLRAENVVLLSNA